METKGMIYELLPKVMASIGAVGKGRKAQMPGGSYAFRGIDDLYNAVQPALIEHGVTVVPIGMELLRRDLIERPNKGPLVYTLIQATYHFVASDGSHVRATTIGEAMDTGDKGANKAMSAAMKYALFQVLCIPTEEAKDTENEHHELPPQAKPTPTAKPETKPAASHPNVPAISALHNKWAKLANNGEADKLGFIQWVKTETGITANLASPAMWDAALIERVGTILNADEKEAA
jgi:hypothetical protein